MKTGGAILFGLAMLMALPVRAESGFAPLAGEIDDQIVILLGQEASALRRIPTTRLNLLVREAPKTVRGGWFFGRRKKKIDTFKYTRASLDAMPAAKGGSQWHCFSEALYFEARGESAKGMFAVGEVILNRVDARNFPDTVCGVVRQGTGRGKHACQFSYNCDGKSEVIDDHPAYQRVAKVARLMLDGEPRVLTRGATYYHATRVTPKWARSFSRTARIGDHLFYRDPRTMSAK